MLHQKEVKSVLNKFKKRDNWFLADYSVNPYEGCSVNCLYCYIRGSKYGENMEDGLTVKKNVLKVFEKQLSNRAKKNQFGFIVVGSAVDAYMHQEKEWQLTRGILEIALHFRFPVFISTKTDLVLRDMDLLKQIDQQAILPDDLKDKLRHGVLFSVSLSSLSEEVTQMLEPAALPPVKRLELVKTFSREGFLAGVNAIPLLPFISNTPAQLEEMIATAKKYEAQYILCGGLTLFGNGPADSKTLYFRFLEKKFPHLIPAYQKIYGSSDYPSRLHQDELTTQAAASCRQYKIRNSLIAS